MSVEVITWALAQRVERSSAKFVLVALANCAGPDGVCWPSLQYLCDATEQDRKTVAENIRRLKEWGFIEPTGEHRGVTAQVVVYRLRVGEEDQKRNDSEIGTVPKSDAKRPENGHEEAQKRTATGPKTGHGTVRTVKNRQEEKKERASALPCPDGVDPQVWDDWLALRKAKKAPVSRTVVQGAEEEAKKAGMSLDAFLRIWCRRGSQGLDASWLKPEERKAAAAETPYARKMREMYEQTSPAIAAPRPGQSNNVIDMENPLAIR